MGSFARNRIVAFPRKVRLQLVAEGLHDRFARGEEAVVLLERGVRHEESTAELERRHLVADRLCGVRRSGLDRCAQLPERGTRSIRKRGQVPLDARRSGHATQLLKKVER
jgi:hypothetical protein